MKSIKMIDFQRIPEISDLKDLEGSEYKEGFVFLIGEFMIEQKHNKYHGDKVTIYRIVRNYENGIMYIPEYYVIEKEN